MSTSSVNGQPVKTVYDYENLDLSQAKNETEVANSIIDLAKTLKANFNEIKKDGVDQNEKMEISFYWLPIIGNALKQIPSKFKNACKDAINQLKQEVINIAKNKDVNIKNYKDANTGIEVNIDKDGNGKVTIEENTTYPSTKNDSTKYEPNATDDQSTLEAARELYNKVTETYIENYAGQSGDGNFIDKFFNPERPNNQNTVNANPKVFTKEYHENLMNGLIQ